MELKEIDINTSNWVDYAQDRGYCSLELPSTIRHRVSQLLGMATCPLGTSLCQILPASSEEKINTVHTQDFEVEQEDHPQS